MDKFLISRLSPCRRRPTKKSKEDPTLERVTALIRPNVQGYVNAFDNDGPHISISDENDNNSDNTVNELGNDTQMDSEAEDVLQQECLRPCRVRVERLSIPVGEKSESQFPRLTRRRTATRRLSSSSSSEEQEKEDEEEHEQEEEEESNSSSTITTTTTTDDEEEAARTTVNGLSPTPLTVCDFKDGRVHVVGDIDSLLVCATSLQPFRCRYIAKVNTRPAIGICRNTKLSAYINKRDRFDPREARQRDERIVTSASSPRWIAEAFICFSRPKRRVRCTRGSHSTPIPGGTSGSARRSTHSSLGSSPVRSVACPGNR
ncbi:hypothetical protein X777_04759 [Ooceraea biroi]|uniref:Uncharacterized protein n=1 Tax=Ooceraea biroi TaxID=2015173 RepID=A0A026WHF6_OOCBI|nr:hypothetical protein X777_04759 [Ooceraea biroi]